MRSRQLVGLMMAERRRRLQRRFGPEYDRLVERRGSRLRAEAELTRHGRRVRRLDIRPLTDEARARYSVQWAGLQEEFVDRPAAAVWASPMLRHIEVAGGMVFEVWDGTERWTTSRRTLAQSSPSKQDKGSHAATRAASAWRVSG